MGDWRRTSWCLVLEGWRRRVQKLSYWSKHLLLLLLWLVLVLVARLGRIAMLRMLLLVLLLLWLLLVLLVLNGRGRRERLMMGLWRVLAIPLRHTATSSSTGTKDKKGEK